MSASLRAIDLAVGYSGRQSRTVVLDSLNFAAMPGELICLLGPNGIGKSTLLRTLSKLQPALSGTIEIDQISLNAMTRLDLARRVGVVLTERPLVGAMPAYRLVELGRYPHVNWAGALTSHDHDAVRSAIEAVSAGHLAARDSNKLSDGERQRFMIARALAQEPSILLLDEPTAFLDVASRVELMGLLRRLARDEQLAIVASTHDLELALRMADTLWLISPDGRLHVGVPEDLIVAGRIDAVFPAESIRFSAEDRTFRPMISPRGFASVQAEGLQRSLVSSVLEREGFAVVENRAPRQTNDIRITVTDDSRWEVASGELRQSGENFAALAAYLRQFGSPSNKIG